MAKYSMGKRPLKPEGAPYGYSRQSLSVILEEADQGFCSKAPLLRHGQRYTGKSSWTAAHERFLAEVSFAQPAQNIAFTEYHSAVREVREVHERVERLSAGLRGQLEHWRMRPAGKALMSLRGIDLIAAVILVAEIGDFRRFARARELSGFVWGIASQVKPTA